MEYFLQDVVRYLNDINHGDFRNTVVVFPNRRARLFFNKYISGLSDKPKWAPKYYSISDFIVSLSGLQLADPLTLVFRLFKIFKDVSKTEESIDSFYHYCELILSDFDEIDKNCVHANMLYQNLGELKAFDNKYEYFTENQINAIQQFWEIFISARDSEEKKQFDEFWGILQEVYNQFNLLLDNEGIAYEGKAYRKVTELIKNGSITFSGEQHVAFIGFNALNRAEEIIFNYFKKTGKALFFWDFDESYLKGDVHEAGFFLRHYIPKFPPPPGFKSFSNLHSPKASIKSVSVPSNIAQAKIIDKYLRECKPGNIENSEQTAIILADENLLLPVITSLPNEIKSVNISMGYPICDTPAFNFISLLADMQTRLKYNTNDKKLHIYHKDYFGILEHQYLSQIANSKQFEEFKRNVRDKNLVYIDPEIFQTENEFYKRIFIKPSGPKNFGHYILDIFQVVVSSIITGKTLSREEQWHLEVFYSLYKILIRFDTLINEQDIDLSLSIVIRLLKKVIGGISVPFSGEPLIGLQLLGILETRTLDFENIIILSMNEGKIPGTSSHNSFIPMSLRKGFGLQTIEHQDAIYAYYFYRLLHKAQNITLVHSSKSEGLQKGEPSRFILQLKYISAFKVEEVNPAYQLTPIKTYTVSASKNAEAINKLKKYIRPNGKSSLSPSALNTYLNCSLRFYFKYIKELDEPQCIDEEIENNVFGSILHKTMQLLYAEYEGKIIDSSLVEKLLTNKELINKSINQAFAEEYFHKSEIEEDDFKGRNLLIHKVIEKYLVGILKFDKRNAPFKIIALEKKFTHEFAVNNNIIELGGYIDRIDEKEGRIRVIDYKTGRVKDKFHDIDSLFNQIPSKRNDAVFQTFLYSLILKHAFGYENIQPSLLFVRNIHNPDFNFKIKMDKETVDNYLPLNAYFEEKIIRLLEEIFSPSMEFTQTDDAKYCDFCPYNAICRK